MRSCKCCATPSIAETSTLFLSCARILAFAFLVPNASPNVARACRNSRAETGADCMPLSAFTLCVRRWSGAARRVVVPVRLLCTPTKYLISNEFYIKQLLGEITLFRRTWFLPTLFVIRPKRKTRLTWPHLQQRLAALQILVLLPLHS